MAVWLWGLLLIAWTPWAWWAPAVALAVTLAVYGTWVLGAAEVYADLLEATFDVHRAALYEALDWPRPASPDEERAVGEALTAYLWRGTVPTPHQHPARRREQPLEFPPTPTRSLDSEQGGQRSGS